MVGCVEPFEPKGLSTSSNFVIDGIITNETKAHQIVFSRTTSEAQVQFEPVSDAEILLVQDESTQVELFESSPGIYETPIMSGIIGSSYQLKVTTSSGEVIESSPVVLKSNPGIESIESIFAEDNRNGRGIDISLSTNEKSEGILYLRWSFEETYEHVSLLPYRFDWVGGNNVVEVDVRDSDTCYVDLESNQVFLFSGFNRNLQKASSIPLRFIPEFSDELQNRYSMEVTQYVLSSEGFDYWTLLDNLNGSQGSTFDIQPGRIIGNLRAESGTPVLGFFDATEIKRQRIFVKTNDFIDSGLMRDPNRLLNCEASTSFVPPFRLGEFMEQFGDQVNIVGTISGVFIVGSKACTDCRLFGSNSKPTFWP